jgi:hypothetical protein
MAGTRNAPRGQRRTRDPSRPLTEEEKQQIVRLFSEPMEFPNEYRSWVKNYIETVGIQLPRSSIVGLKQATTTTARQVLDERLPPGSVFLFAGEEPPPGTVRYEPEAEARSLPELAAPPGLMYVIVTENRPQAVPES